MHPLQERILLSLYATVELDLAGGREVAAAVVVSAGSAVFGAHGLVASWATVPLGGASLDQIAVACVFEDGFVGAVQTHLLQVVPWLRAALKSRKVQLRLLLAGGTLDEVFDKRSVGLQFVRWRAVSPRDSIRVRRIVLFDVLGTLELRARVGMLTALLARGVPT